MKRILISLSIIAVVATIAIGGTIAYFQDTETSSGNTFSAGILDLKIRDQDEDWGDGVHATWTAPPDVKPGDAWDFRIPLVQMQESWDSTVPGNHLEITSDYSVVEENPCLEGDTDCQTNLHPGEMAKEMLITRCIYKDFGCIDCLTGEKRALYNSSNHTCTGTLLGQSNDWKIEDQNGDGKISFYDLKNDVLDNLPPPVNMGMYDYEMGVKFANEAGNDFQGDIFDLTMIFTLNQDASQ
ncbi:MAG: TasA family protein [Patescibacteria group bacterium]